jgi:hypothetical protein
MSNFYTTARDSVFTWVYKNGTIEKVERTESSSIKIKCVNEKGSVRIIKEK